MESVCRVVLASFIGFGGVPSLVASVNNKKEDFSIDQFIQPAKFLPDLSRSGGNDDNSTLQRFAKELLKTINHTNSPRTLENVNTIFSSEDTETLLVYNDGSVEESLFKKKFTICLGLMVVLLGCFILYRKVCCFYTETSITLPSLHRVDTPPPPPYYLFAPPTYDEWACGRIKQKVKPNDAVVDIEWPGNPIKTTTITTSTTTTTTAPPYDQIVKDSFNEKIL